MANDTSDVKLDYAGLPGAERVRLGLADLQAGERSPEALLLAAATGRLRGLGVPVPRSAKDIEEPEMSLYRVLCERMQEPGDDPYYRYNSWRRELDSFILALERQLSSSSMLDA